VEFYGVCSSPNIASSNQRNEMGSAHGMYGEGRGEVHTGFWWRNLMERVHLED